MTTQVLEVPQVTAKAEALEAIAEDTSHLIVEIDQETYDVVNEIAGDAGARGMQDGFEFWLCRLARQHAKVQENLWRRSDDTSMFVRAQRGNKQAARSVLKSLGLDDKAIDNLIARPTVKK